MAGTDKSNHRGHEVTPKDSAKGPLVDNIHQDPKLAYKEHADLGKQIKLANDALQNTLKNLAHPTDEQARQQVEDRNKFADAYYKASAGQLIDSMTGIVSDAIKFIAHQQQAARDHDVKSAVSAVNPLKPVGEIIGNMPKIARSLNAVSPQGVIEMAKTPGGQGTLLGGAVFIASQLELPGNKLKAASEIKSLNAAKEMSNVGKIEEDTRKKYAYLKTATSAEHAGVDLPHTVKMKLSSGKEVEAVETKLADGVIQRKFTDVRGGKEIEITQTKDAEKTVTQWEGNKVTQYLADKRKVHEKPDGSVETTYQSGLREIKAADGSAKTVYEKPIPLGPGEKHPDIGESVKPHAPKMPTEAEIGKALEEAGLVKLAKNGRYEQTENNCWDIASRLAKQFGYEMPDSKAAIIKLVEDHLGRRAGYRPNLKMPNEGGYLIIREIPGNLSEPMHITFASGGQEYNFGVTKNDNHNIVLRIPIAKRKN